MFESHDLPSIAYVHGFSFLWFSRVEVSMSRYFYFMACDAINVVQNFNLGALSYDTVRVANQYILRVQVSKFY